MDGKKKESGDQPDRDGGWPCSKCELTFATQGQREHHKYYTKNHILCLYCPESAECFEFDTEAALHQHCVRHHGKEYCTFCREHQHEKWVSWLYWHRRGHTLGRRNVCCGQTFDTMADMERHLITSQAHRYTCCRFCKRNFETAEGRTWHLEHECESYLGSSLPPRIRAKPQPGFGARPRLYEILGVDQTCSQQEVLKAAKRMRIANHPDKLKRKGGLSVQDMMAIDAKAQEVGHAADVLSDLSSRAKYDMDVLAGVAK